MAKADFIENWSVQSSPVVTIVTGVTMASFLSWSDGRQGGPELSSHTVEDPVVLLTENNLIISCRQTSPGSAYSSSRSSSWTECLRRGATMAPPWLSRLVMLLREVLILFTS